MSKQFLYVNANGDYEESINAFEVADHIQDSVGVADAYKPVITTSTGYLDAGLINVAGIDHGSLAGLGDDDHTQYILVTGTRPFTGPQSMGNNKITSLANGTANSDAVNFGQLAAVDAKIGTFEWQESVISRLDNPPGSPGEGDRYLVTSTALGAWAGKEGDIATYYTSTGWTFYVPTVGTFVSVDNEPTKLYYFGGVWEAKYFEATTASNGLIKVGMDIRVNLAANSGLAVVADELTSDWATPPWNWTKPVKSIDLYSTSTGYGASIIGINDAGGYTTQTNVEGALQEIYASLATSGAVSFTVGTGGVTKGDLVYISANDTVRTMSSLTANVYGVGLAYTTQTAGQSVIALGDDLVLTGVLSGATAGTKYYWDGSAIVSTLPSGSGKNIWQVGVAKNATDLYVEVRYVKKNA